MLVITYFTGTNFDATISTTAIQIIVGIITYTVILILLKDEFLKEVMKTLKNKVSTKFSKKCWRDNKKSFIIVLV